MSDETRCFGHARRERWKKTTEAALHIARVARCAAFCGERPSETSNNLHVGLEESAAIDFNNMSKRAQITVNANSSIGAGALARPTQGELNQCDVGFAADVVLSRIGKAAAPWRV
jgi:hypothetical protein